MNMIARFPSARQTQKVRLSVRKKSCPLYSRIKNGFYRLQAPRQSISKKSTVDKGMLVFEIAYRKGRPRISSRT